MRAVIVHHFGDLDSATVEEVADPVPGPHDVLVRVQASPANYVDLLTLRGEYQFLPDLPFVPGKGPAGVVADVGYSVTGLERGDRVLAMGETGGYAELIAVNHQQVYPLPPQLTFTDAAAMSLAYDTAWVALRDRARLKPGESVLVLGAGGAVGQATVQLARAMGAGEILGGFSRPGQQRIPVDSVIDLSEPDPRSSIREQVFAATDGRGVDIVIDPVGGNAFDGAVRSIAWRGRLVVVGFASGRIPLLKMNYPLLKNIEVSGLQVSDYRKRLPQLMKECYREIFDFYVRGHVTPPACITWPLADWRTAIEHVAAGGSLRQVILPAGA